MLDKVPMDRPICLPDQYPSWCWASGLLLIGLMLRGSPVPHSDLPLGAACLKQKQCVNTARGAVYLPRWKVICVCLWNTTLDMKPGHTQIQSFIHSLIHSFIHAFTYSFLYFLFIHSVIHLYIYLSMFYFWQNWFPDVLQLNSCEHCQCNVTTLSW